ADVVDLLSHLIPDVRHLRRACRIFKVHEDRSLARGRVALQVVEIGRLLELALEAVGDLLERVADRGSGPPDLHDHRLDGEVGILAPAEPEVGPDARHHDDEHEIDHERTVPDRPFGEVEVHQTAPRRRTFWPGRSVCTPPVTTSAPVSRPWEITTEAGSYRRTATLRRDTVLLCGSTTHTAGRPPVSVRALAGTSTPGGAKSRKRPTTVAPSCMASGGSATLTLTWNVRVAESAWGAISRT